MLNWMHYNQTGMPLLYTYFHKLFIIFIFICSVAYSIHLFQLIYGLLGALWLKCSQEKLYSQEQIVSIPLNRLHSLIITINFPDIDQLTRILALCGTPTQETMEKISSVEVMEKIIEK